MRHVFKNENKPEEKLDSLLIHLVLGTVIGARLGHVLFYDPEYYFSHPLEIVMVWKGGLASHGGGIGVLTAIYLFCKKHGFSYLWSVDRLAIPVALTGAFIRLGNFFNSEILGIPSSVPWAVIFSRIDQIPRHPVQLYESFTYAVIFVVLLLIYKKKDHNPQPGLLIGVFLVMVFTARMLLEGLKSKQAAFEPAMSLSMGQWLSIPFLLAGIFFVYRAIKAK
jgi:prolipoprotein diacylglyceryl transferase